MTKKKFALATGLLSLLGLATFLGHKKQVRDQQNQSAILSEVRQFFATMGTIEVVYVTEVNSRAGTTSGGVVFDDGVTFEFRYKKGDIDYRELAKIGDDDEYSQDDASKLA